MCFLQIAKQLRELFENQHGERKKGKFELNQTFFTFFDFMGKSMGKADFRKVKGC